MNTQNPFIDTMIDAQKKAVSNWVDTTKKFQDAFTVGKIQSEGQSIYSEWLEKQMSIFSGAQANFGTNGHSDGNVSKPEEFFKNWYNQQAANVKQMTDFNQSIYNSFVNYGKNPQDYASNFANMNSAWTSVYNTWMNAINSSFETMKKNIPDTLNQEMFKKFFEGNKAYVQLQEMWAPIFKSMQNNEFSMDKLKGLMDMEVYKKITEQMFSPFVSNAGMNEVFEMATKNMQSFFQTNNQLSKEYVHALQQLSQKYPELISGDFAKVSELYSQMNDVFGKTFSPVLNLMSSAKEKEQVEALVQLMDKVAEYSVRQTQLQRHFYATSQKAMEQAAKSVASKWNATMTENQSFNEFYNEWIKINEAAFTELYQSEEFSKLKSDVLSAGADVKRSFEKQFEQHFSVYPVVFRSEIEELHKTIYDLKKQIKSLEAKLNDGSEVKEEKNAKRK
jgi:polyhydroxyalkanoate synthase subunit PhaE